jgi:hypothetical protein
MTYYRNIVALAAVAAFTTPALLSAQPSDTLRIAQAGPKSKQSPRYDPQYDIEELTPSQIQRAQEPDRPAPPRITSPNSPSTTLPGDTTPPAGTPKTTATPRAPSPSTPPEPARTVACSGAFSKTSNHIHLVQVYKPGNVVFTSVEAQGQTVMASVLFSKDPKRRLEVWWENPESRSGTHLIVIGGQSTWGAPKGLRLGLTLPAVEKLNGKPFKLRHFDKDNQSMITDWQGGALAQLPGGCRLGVSLQADAKAPASAMAELTAENEFTSNDAILRPVKATVSEILLGY